MVAIHVGFILLSSLRERSNALIFISVSKCAPNINDVSTYAFEYHLPIAALTLGSSCRDGCCRKCVWIRLRTTTAMVVETVMSVTAPESGCRVKTRHIIKGKYLLLPVWSGLEIDLWLTFSDANGKLCFSRRPFCGNLVLSLPAIDVPRGGW